VSNLLPHEEIALHVFNAFSTHRHQVIDEFWDESEFVQIRLEPNIETWSPPTQLLRRLWRHLPFERHLRPKDYEDVVNSLHLVKEDAREQLFYWYTAGPLTSNLQGTPVNSLTLFVDSTRFWFQHIAPIQQYLKDQIQQGRRFRYLERFHLNYDRIELSFSEIRISQIQFGTFPPNIQAPYRLVICPGREHTFCWSITFWETSLDNPNQNLVNPADYRLPPTVQTPQLVANAATTCRPTTERIDDDESSDEDYSCSRLQPTPPLLRQNPQLRIFAPPIVPLVSRISNAATSDSDSR
jgi:hypothetical protein